MADSSPNTTWWQEFRRQMPVASRWAYFDHAAVAPLTRNASQAICNWSKQAAEHGDTIWTNWSGEVERCRRLAANLAGTDPSEIAFVKNTTDGISLIAEGYPWQHGDNVVTLDNEFPSNQYPWLNLSSRGVETRRVETHAGRVDLNRLAEAMDDRTRIIAVSWIGYASGWRCSVPELADVAHSNSALLFLDAIQGLGVFPMRAADWGVDFLAADGHKWMLGPEGAGILQVRREHLDRLRPLGVGWNSVRHSHDYNRIETDWKDSAVRYEGGSPNMVGIHGLAASLELLLSFGIEKISTRIIELTDTACQRLEQAGAKLATVRERGHKSGIVTFELPGQEPRDVRSRALKMGIALSCRAGKLRISPHAYQNEADLDRLMELVSS